MVQHLAPLVEGAVHQSDRDYQFTGSGEPGRGEATAGSRSDSRQQVIQGGGFVQWWQPYPVSGPAVSGQPGHHHIQHTFGERVLLRRHTGLSFPAYHQGRCFPVWISPWIPVRIRVRPGSGRLRPFHRRN